MSESSEFCYSSTSTIALAPELPVAIEINGLSYAVMMLSPDDLDDFAYGYLLTEGIINTRYDIHDIELQHTKQHGIPAICLQIHIAQRCEQKLKNKHRSVMGASGCGLCGVQALEQAFPRLRELPQQTAFALKNLQNIRQSIALHQTRSQASGAMHAACWTNAFGEIEYCREDIGRHNALDKLIGCMLKNNVEIANGAITVTSRCSAELVQKVLVAKVSTLVSLASPSALASQIASDHGLTLIHVPKNDKPIVFAPRLANQSSLKKHDFQEYKHYE